MALPLTGKSLIPHPPTEGEGSMKRALMKRILCSLLATLPFGSVLGKKRIHSRLIHRIPLIYAPKQLATDHTASGLEILSCYPPRRVAGEKGRHVGNILRRANTLERRLTGSVVVVLFGHHVRISESWR
jgi:hypothetical protein